MDHDLFLQYLRDLPIEDGRAYIREHIDELSDYQAIGELMADEALRVLYTPFLSLKIAELLIFYGELTGHLSSHALGLKAKGDVLFQIEHHQAALEFLDAAGEQFLSLGDKGNWARSRISWVLSAGWLGRVEDALKAGEQARSVFLQLHEYYWAAVIDNNIAWVLDNIGRYQDALALYDNMLKVFPNITDQGEDFIARSIAIAKVNQGRLLSWLGKFNEAYLLQEEAQASFLVLGEKDLVVEVEINLAELDNMQGYYGSALRRYYKARESLLQSDRSNVLILAELKLAMANCLIKLNRAQEACLLCEEAVKTYRESGISLTTANALRDYAAALMASGRLKEALHILDEAWDLFNRGGFEPLAFLTRLQQAELLLEMGVVDDAYELARQVKGYCDTHGLVARSVRASIVITDALIQKAQTTASQQKIEQQGMFLDEVINLCNQMKELAQQHHLQEEIYKSHYLLGQIFALYGDSAKAADYYETAITQIEHILDNLTHDLSPSFLRTAWAVCEAMIALCLKEGQNDLAFNYLERVRSITLRQYLNNLRTPFSQEKARDATSSVLALRTQHELKEWQERYRSYTMLLSDIDFSISPTLDKEIIEKELKRCEVKLSELFERLHLHQLDVTRRDKRPSRRGIKPDKSLRNRENIHLEQLQQHISSEQLLLAYYLYKDQLVIFAITKEQLITHVNPTGAAQLEQLLPLFHAHLQPAGWADPRTPPQQVIRRLLSKLYNLLIAPVESLLPSMSGCLTIVPYGPLHQLPFHALFDGTHFLIENIQISYLSASSLLLHLSSNGGKRNTSSLNAKVATKSPLVLAYSGNWQLQRVQDEAKIIVEIMGGRCYLEREATIARLIEEAPGSSVIHLATHGKSRLDAPDFSYVRLADGQLNAIDAFSLNLEKCELVTLSGCETGLALSSGGDEQLGLGRAFLAAGATSLVMSLWPVEDSTTNELMKRFYQNLSKGESKVQALRDAQCGLLHEENLGSTHPYFWAAFRLVGEVGPLKYQRARNTSLRSTIQPPKKSSLIV